MRSTFFENGGKKQNERRSHVRVVITAYTRLWGGVDGRSLFLSDHCISGLGTN